MLPSLWDHIFLHGNDLFDFPLFFYAFSYLGNNGKKESKTTRRAYIRTSKIRLGLAGLANESRRFGRVLRHILTLLASALDGSREIVLCTTVIRYVRYSSVGRDYLDLDLERPSGGYPETTQILLTVETTRLPKARLAVRAQNRTKNVL
jgi:hypothetical protein